MRRHLFRSLALFALLLPAMWCPGQSRRKPAAPVAKRFQPAWVTISQDAASGTIPGFAAKLFRTGHVAYCTSKGYVYLYALPDTASQRLWRRIDALPDAAFRSYEPEYPTDGGAYYLRRDHGPQRTLRAVYMLPRHAPVVAALHEQLQRALQPPAGVAPRPPLVRTPQTTVAELFPCSF
ncbi:hypothetical protein N008_13745 [Hymenobacter sp. APR13]|nr:hypothetical protein N008_13745 [Hymenobacter sp. APR13]